jgi:putative transposase
MKWLMHPLLTLIANATESELAKYIEYLKVENRILRACLREQMISLKRHC